jgi:hypothetical protein
MRGSGSRVCAHVAHLILFVFLARLLCEITKAKSCSCVTRKIW